MKKPTILFLYSELAEYFINCCHALKEKADVHVIRWPINDEAPFQFDFFGLNVFQKDEFASKYDLLSYVDQIKPDIIVCSGWIDDDYNWIIKNYKEQTKTVICIDNNWTGSLKQHLLSIISPFTIKARFDKIWIPGKAQLKYARRLRFKKKNILTGFYSADNKLFNEVFEKRRDNPKRKKQFLYIGRYISRKGIFQLWDAFERINKIYPDWELICIGKGDEWENRKIHPNIKHLGFLQPIELQKQLKDISFFVLPSHYEPWGVVVHEMACAGIPILCSEVVGASKDLVIDNLTGWNFTPNDTNSLFNAMKKAIETPKDRSFEIEKNSFEKSKEISTSKWVDTILSVLKN